VVWVFFIAVAVLVVVVALALAAGRVVVDPVPPPATTTPEVGLGPGFHAQDIHDVRFDTALRGYRMDQVDDVLDALYARIVELEARESESESVQPEDVEEPTA
jgi:DivIVA domain-containing protein